MDINNSVVTVHDSMMDMYNFICVIGIVDIRSMIMDIHNSIMDTRN